MTYSYKEMRKKYPSANLQEQVCAMCGGSGFIVKRKLNP